ncbi:alpha/beta hydrolase [Streptomyces olivaceoviridis]|uniref:alpha/beta hydrolase n=1 Tax=Streptomyces olivaceoviridis TaxID=1921 RepID=UPI00379E77B2
MNRTPVVFLHGAWLHALSFESWADRFVGRGFLAVAPGWPGEAATVRATRAFPEALGGLGPDTLTDHYGGIVRAFDTPPVIVGHSVGGLIAQHLLTAGWGRAAVSVAPAPINDVPLPHCQARPWTPDHADPGDRLVSLSPERFRAVFADTAPAEESGRIFERYAVPAPRRLLADLGCAGVDVARAGRGPLLLISGREDRLVPGAVTRAVSAGSTGRTSARSAGDRHRTCAARSPAAPAGPSHALLVAELAQRVTERGPRADAQFGEDPVEVGADRAR